MATKSTDDEYFEKIKTLGDEEGYNLTEDYNAIKNSMFANSYSPRTGKVYTQEEAKSLTPEQYYNDLIKVGHGTTPTKDLMNKIADVEMKSVVGLVPGLITKAQANLIPERYYAQTMMGIGEMTGSTALFKYGTGLLDTYKTVKSALSGDKEALKEINNASDEPSLLGGLMGNNKLGNLIKEKGQANINAIEQQNQMVYSGSGANVARGLGNLTGSVGMLYGGSEIGSALGPALGTTANVGSKLGAIGAGAYTSGARTATYSNSDLDVALDALKGGATTATFIGISNALSNALPVIKNPFGNFAKNAGIGATSGYGSTTVNKLLTNVNNIVKGEKVTSDDWLKSFVSSEHALSAGISALGYGLQGTLNDKKILNQKNPSLKANKVTKEEAYKVLGLKSNATEEEIISASRKLVKSYHTDTGGAGANTEKLNEVLKARDYLLENIEPNTSLFTKIKNAFSEFANKVRTPDTKPTETQVTNPYLPASVSNAPAVNPVTANTTNIAVPNAVATKNPNVPATSEKKNEVMSFKFANGDYVEVIKNPTEKQEDEMRKEAKTKYSQDYLKQNPDEPLLRRTYDNEGNVYRWQSIDSTHYHIENFLKDKYPDKQFNQNQFFDEKSKATSTTDLTTAKISPERLNAYLKEWTNSSPNYSQAYLTRMTPDDFLSLTASDSDMKHIKIDNAKRAEQGWTLDKVKYDPEETTEPQAIKLTVDFDTGEVIGHEGRHRMQVLKDNGIKNVDVVIKPYAYSESFDRSNPQKYIDKITVTQQYGVKPATVLLKDLDVISPSNLDYIKEKYLGESDNSFVYEPASSKPLTSKQNSDIIPQTVERKPEVGNYEYKRITNQDRARLSSDFLTNRDKYKRKVGFVDFAYRDKNGKEGYITYNYARKGDEIELVKKYRGSEEYIKKVKEGFSKNGIDRGPKRNTTNVSGSRRGRRGASSSDVFSGRPEESNAGSGRIDKTRGQGNANNARRAYGNIDKSLENSNKSSFSMSKKLPKELPVTKRKFLEEIKQVGYVNVNGAQINSVEDLADLAQCFRDPVAETTRLAFTNKGKIIVQGAFSRDDPRKVPFTSGDVDRFVDKTVAELRARGYEVDGFWEMHNHPSGQAVASDGDKKHRTEIDKLRRHKDVKLLGDIVLDHNEYAIVHPDGTSQDHVKLREKTYNEIEKKFSKEGWTDIQVFQKGDKTWQQQAERVASLASYVKNGKDLSTLVLLDQDSKVRLLQSLSNDFFTNSKRKIQEYVKDLALKNGATMAVYATQDPQTHQNMIKNIGSSPALVLYKDNGDGSLTLEKAYKVGNKMLYASRNTGAREISPSIDTQLKGPQTSLEEIKKQFAEEPKPAKEKPLNKKTKEITKQPEKKPELPKNLTLQKQSKDVETLEKAVNKYRDKLAKQKDMYEKKIEELKKNYAEKSKVAKEKQKLTLNRNKEKQKELQKFRRASSPEKLKILEQKIREQMKAYEVSGFPELDENYEKLFGVTIRDTIKALLARPVFKKLPDKMQELIENYADETYLKANWKTFDKYLREALQQDQLKAIMENTNAPVSERLLKLMKEHAQAPITIKNAGEMKQDLDALLEVINTAQQALQFKRSNPELDKAIKDAKPELEKITSQKALVKQRDGMIGKFVDAKGSVGEFFKVLSEYPAFLPTRIQMLFDGNPESAFKPVWEWYLKGAETEMELDVKFARLFDKFVEHSKLHGYTYKGELGKDYGKDPEWIDTGTSAGKIPKAIMMWLAGTLRDTDNLMHITPVLLGADKQGNPVYSTPGGIVIPNERLYKAGKIDEAYSNGRTVTLTPEEIEKIVGMLTPLEKEFVDACMQVGKLVQEYGNPVSLRLTGEKIFPVDNYLRIVVDQDTLNQELIDPTDLSNLTNAYSKQIVGIDGVLGRGGSLEARTHRSTRPIYAEDILQAVTNSFKGAVNYIAYAEPIYDTDVLLKTRYPDTYKLEGTTDKDLSKTRALGIEYEVVDKLPDYASERTKYLIKNGDNYEIYSLEKRGDTMRKIIAQTGDTTFYKYYDNFLRQLLRLNKDKSYLSKAIAKYGSIRAGVVLHTNINVVGVQALSYTQIARFLDHPLSSTIKGIFSGKTILNEAKKFLTEHGQDFEGLKGQEIVNKFLENATYLNTYRGLGKYTPEVEYIERRRGILGRVNSGSMMSLADKITVDATFRALMMDILASGKKFGSDEFIAELKRRVIGVHLSNPSYLRIFKTPLQTSNRAVAVSIAQFNTVMIEGYNNYLQESMAYKYYKKTGNKEKQREHWKKRNTVATALAISGGVAGLLLEGINELKGKEDDRSFVERVLATTALKIASYTIIGDEILSFILSQNNYELTTNELAYANDILEAIQYTAKAIGGGKASDWIKASKAILRSIGVPANNIENDFAIIGRMTNSKVFKAYSVYKDSNMYEKYQANKQAIKDIAKFYDVYKATRKKAVIAKFGKYNNDNILKAIKSAGGTKKEYYNMFKLGK